MGTQMQMGRKKSPLCMEQSKQVPSPEGCTPSWISMFWIDIPGIVNSECLHSQYCWHIPLGLDQPNSTFIFIQHTDNFSLLPIEGQPGTDTSIGTKERKCMEAALNHMRIHCYSDDYLFFLTEELCWCDTQSLLTDPSSPTYPVPVCGG